MAPRRAPRGAPLLALLALLVVVVPRAAAQPAAVSQCSWDGSAQLCDVSPAFILMNGSINVNDTVADALIRALARDALCNMAVDEASCTNSTNLTCAWDEASVRAAREGGRRWD
jgi:hypothetical protein